jgi:hypothetical protein
MVLGVCRSAFYSEHEMNERIRLLAEQAEKYALDNVGKGHYGIEDLIYQFQFADTKMTKFAELIVRECAAMTRNLSAHGELAEKAVKEHFGVEE